MKQQVKTARFITEETAKTVLIRLPWLLLIPIGLLLPRVFARNAEFVERVYSQGIYPVLQSILRVFFSSVPFSIVEWILYAAIILLPSFLLFRTVRAMMGSTRWVRVLHLCVTYLIIFGAALNLFYIVWGFNYSRPTLSTLLELNVRERPAEELEALCYALAEEAATLRTLVKEDAEGIYTVSGGISALMKKIPEAYQALGKEIPLFRLRAVLPKQVLNSEAMSWAGIAGIYIPFTAEANVNVHQQILLLASAAAHESAHSLGIARENEANFVSYLACARSTEPAIRYSGVMLALIHSGNQLNKEDKALYDALYATYSEGMVRDLHAQSAYWKQYEGVVEKTVNRVNDNYLKHNQQESGVKSYGEMVDLLLAWQEKFLK